MSIRNYFLLLLPLLFSSSLFSESTKELKQFKRTHDLVFLIKNVRKNQDRVVKFSLSDLSDEEYQVNVIEREDFLPKEMTWSSVEIGGNNVQCNFYEQTVGAEDEKQIMLTVGLPDPLKKQYLFIMNDQYKCLMVVAVPNTVSRQKPTTKEKAREYVGKLQQNISLAWKKLLGKK